MPWTRTHKGDPRCIALADKHYSRQSPGSPQFCRPGYNLVLYAADARGATVFVWWRPRWDVGRKDGLRAIECTIFRNESGYLSSFLIDQAVACLLCWFRYDGESIITSVNSEKTRSGRAAGSLPGKCFRAAGWVDLEHRQGKADVWLQLPVLPAPRRWMEKQLCLEFK